MDRNRLVAAQNWIREELKGVADFWLKNGMDKIHGGVYTCLDRSGDVFSTDKSGPSVCCKVNFIGFPSSVNIFS